MSAHGSAARLLGPHVDRADMDDAPTATTTAINGDGEAAAALAPPALAPIKLYKRRWLMLAVFCALSGLMNLLVFAYAPITSRVCEYYNGGTCDGSSNEIISIEYGRLVLSGRRWAVERAANRLGRRPGRVAGCPSPHSAVFLLCAIPLITAIPLFLSGPILMVKIPLNMSVWFLCGTTALGAVIRYAFTAATLGGYVSCLIGQFFISLGQVVTWAGPTRVRPGGAGGTGEPPLWLKT